MPIPPPADGASSPLTLYERVARAMSRLFAVDDEGALEIVGAWSGGPRSFDDVRRYIRDALGEGLTDHPPHPPRPHLSLDAARLVVARAHEFATWDALRSAVERAGAPVLRRAVRIHPASRDDDDTTTHTWDEMLARLSAAPEPHLEAQGQMTDEVLARVAAVGHVTGLDLEGSRDLTGAGLRALAGLPSLRHLSLTGCSGLDDDAVQVLRQLPQLESLSLAWTAVTDRGLRALTSCTRLRSVDLMGTPSGDGAIRALSGHRELRDLRTGDLVTGGGLTALHDLPRFAHWSGEPIRMALCGFSAEPTYLLLRGTFAAADLHRLAGLDGLFALNLDDRRLGLTAAALPPLRQLAHLGWLAFDADDDAMPHLAALPRLRFLMCQDTMASDDGFVALSRSRSLEYLWGRRCHGLGRRGFEALSTLPDLRGLSVSCRNVDDAGLAALPRFAALSELMPMDVPDEGYRHVGRCVGLESLVLMYCRNTGDTATEHICRLPRLRTYFASHTRITDRTPTLLSGCTSLEHVTLDGCQRVTTAGVAALAALPRLRQVDIAAMPRVAADVATHFAPAVRVRHRY